MIFNLLFDSRCLVENIDCNVRFSNIVLFSLSCIFGMITCNKYSFRYFSLKIMTD